jgi:hypothetical protein
MQPSLQSRHRQTKILLMGRQKACFDPRVRFVDEVFVAEKYSALAKRI